MKNYPDYFVSIGKNMIKKSDGSFMVVTDAEMEQLLRENRISLETPKAMSGKVTDYAQKPIMVLKD